MWQFDLEVRAVAAGEKVLAADGRASHPKRGNEPSFFAGQALGREQKKSLLQQATTDS